MKATASACERPQSKRRIGTLSRQVRRGSPSSPSSRSSSIHPQSARLPSVHILFTTSRQFSHPTVHTTTRCLMTRRRTNCRLRPSPSIGGFRISCSCTPPSRNDYLGLHYHRCQRSSMRGGSAMILSRRGEGTWRGT